MSDGMRQEIAPTSPAPPWRGRHVVDDLIAASVGGAHGTTIEVEGSSFGWWRTRRRLRRRWGITATRVDGATLSLRRGRQALPRPPWPDAAGTRTRGRRRPR